MIKKIKLLPKKLSYDSVESFVDHVMDLRNKMLKGECVPIIKPVSIIPWRQQTRTKLNKLYGKKNG